MQCDRRHRTLSVVYEPHFYPMCLWICWWVWYSLFIYFTHGTEANFCLSQCLSSVNLCKASTSSIGALISVYLPLESLISHALFVGCLVIFHVYRFVNIAALPSKACRYQNWADLLFNLFQKRYGMFWHEDWILHTVHWFKSIYKDVKLIV